MSSAQGSERFDALSRQAATGTLSAPEREWLDAYLREHPDRRADLEWDEAFSEQLDAKVAQMPALPGWERTQRALRAERAPPARPGVLDRCSQWLADSLGFAINLQAVAAALVVVQAGLIGMLAWPPGAPQDDASRVRAGVQDPAPRGPLLRISFRQDLREAELRQALAEVSGEIVGGPGQIGVYLVRIQDGDLSAAAARLRAGGTTELVELVGPGR